MAYCLPPNLVERFKKALRDRTLDIGELSLASSKDRRAAFAEFVGEEHAKEVNALFESKLLLKDQKAGLIDWIKTTTGMKPQVRDDILQRIQGMEDVLESGTTMNSFLEDLARQKLGMEVTSQEAENILRLSMKAEQFRMNMTGPAGSETRIAYGNAVQDLQDYLELLKPNGQTSTQKLVNWLTLPRNLQTSVFHFSAPFVQAWGMIGTKGWYKALWPMFKYLWDEKNYRDFNAYMLSHPDYNIVRESKLGLTYLSDKLSLREEAIQSTLLEKWNQHLTEATDGFVPNIVRANSRAFTGFLNNVRFNSYINLINEARRSGYDISPGSKVSQELATVVNNFTGRGRLFSEDAWRAAAPYLNTVFYSPSKVAGTIQMLNPANYLNPNISPIARMQAFKQLAGSVAVTSTILGLATLMIPGAKTSTDITSSDFGKLVIGDTKLEITGGNDIYARLLGRLAYGSEVTASGKEIEIDPLQYNGVTRASLIGQWVRGKLSPTASFIMDALYGEDPIGRPFDLTEEVRDKMLPIAMNSWINLWQQDPNNTSVYLPAAFAALGVGLEPPLPEESRLGTTVWGEPTNWWERTPKNELDKAISQAGISVHVPYPKINGIKLTDDQYRDYLVQSGMMAREFLEPLVTDPSWGDLPQGMKMQQIRYWVNKSRILAQEQIKAESWGTDNDIVEKSNEAKLKLMGQ